MKRFLAMAAIFALATVSTAFAKPCPGCPGSQGCCMGQGMCQQQMGDKDMDCPQMGPGMHKEMRGMHGMRQGMGPMGGRMGMMRNGTPETLRGRVASIEKGPQGGVRLMVESDSRITPVLLGPPERAEQFMKDLEPNDRVEVDGMRVMRAGRSVLIARQVSTDDDEDMMMQPPEKPMQMHRMEMHRQMRRHAY
jgi:hypothetical protein